MSGIIIDNGATFKIDFRFNPRILEAIKSIPGRKFDYNDKTWSVPRQSIEHLRKVAQQHNLSFGNNQPPEQVGIIEELPELTIDIPLKRTLFPFQARGVAYNLQKKRVLVGDLPGLGKAQPLYSKIATPSGFVTMGSIKVGDDVFGADGKITKVTGVFPQGERPTYRVMFNDGFAVDCDIDHLWSVRDSNRRQKRYESTTDWTVKSLKEIIDSGVTYKINKKRAESGRKPTLKYEIPLCSKVQYQEKDFYIHPYILGLLLGDGCLSRKGRQKKICVSIPDSEIESLERITKLLPNGIKLYANKYGSCPQYYFNQNARTTKPNPFYAEIVNLGLNVMGHDKFIPTKYLTASIEQRIELLRGLMDSDGSAKLNRITFHTKAEGLVKGISELVQSLGGQVIVRKYDRTLSGKGHEYQVNVKVHFNPFHMERKANQWRLPLKNHASRYIESVEFIGNLPTQCISVDAKDKLYLTDNYTITHNTTQAFSTIIGAQAYPCLIICPNSLKENWRREIENFTHQKAIILQDNIRATFQLYYESGLAQFFIVNYESLKKFFVVSMDKREKGKPFTIRNIHFNKLATDFFRAVIIDESHRVKSTATIQTKLTKGICIGKEWILALSGTPVINKPKDLVAQLGIIDQFNQIGGYKHFMERYCAGPKQASNLRELNYRLTQTCFYQRKKEDVLKDLPDKTRNVVLCDISTRHEYNEALQDLSQYLKKYKEATDEQVARSMRGEVMVRIGVLKNISARGKMKEVQEHIEDLHEQGQKVVVFIHLKEIAAKVKELFTHAVSITGDDSLEQRQQAIDSFQNDPKCNIIVCNFKSGGVGVTLTASSYVSFIELPWTAADCQQCEDRCHRIGQKDNVTATYFLGQNTIDEWIYKIIAQKRDIAGQITGNDDNTQEVIIDKLYNLFNAPKE